MTVFQYLLSEVQRKISYTFHNEETILGSVGAHSYTGDMQLYFHIGNTYPRANLQIGKFCSIGEHIQININYNHDYNKAATSTDPIFKPMDYGILMPDTVERCEVLIGHDVWIGSGAFLATGIKIGCGAVVGSGAVVTKDVPPYAIVGGNPAKVIKYRFNEEQIEKLLQIKWWNWDDEKTKENRDYFHKPIDEFIDQFYDEKNPQKTNDLVLSKGKNQDMMLLYPDFEDPNPVWKDVVRGFFHSYNGDEIRILGLRIPYDQSFDACLKLIESILEPGWNDNQIIIINDLVEDWKIFDYADSYITTRLEHTIDHMVLAKEKGVTIYSGVSRPLFKV